MVMVSPVSLQYSDCRADFCVCIVQSIYQVHLTLSVARDILSISCFLQKDPQHLSGLVRRTLSVHWVKLSFVGMVTSHDLLFVGYYDIARSLYNS
jgi:hypothetical protein